MTDRICSADLTAPPHGGRTRSAEREGSRFALPRSGARCGAAAHVARSLAPRTAPLYGSLRSPPRLRRVGALAQLTALRTMRSGLTKSLFCIIAGAPSAYGGEERALAITEPYGADAPPVQKTILYNCARFRASSKQGRLGAVCIPPLSSGLCPPGGSARTASPHLSARCALRCDSPERGSRVDVKTTSPHSFQHPPAPQGERRIPR